MKKLIEQILKFGVVGVVCFLIDFLITMGLSTLLRSVAGMPTGSAALVGAFFGFTISVIVNYLLSMKYVFVRKEDMDRKKEFIIFTISIDVLYENWTWLKNLIGPTTVTAAAKIVATAIVMVYNFITRKIFLEQKEG